MVAVISTSNGATQWQIQDFTKGSPPYRSEVVGMFSIFIAYRHDTSQEYRALNTKLYCELNDNIPRAVGILLTSYHLKLTIAF